MVQKSNLEIASSELQSKATFLGSKGDKKNKAAEKRPWGGTRSFDPVPSYLYASQRYKQYPNHQTKQPLKTTFTHRSNTIHMAFKAFINLFLWLIKHT